MKNLLSQSSSLRRSIHRDSGDHRPRRQFAGAGSPRKARASLSKHRASLSRAGNPDNTRTARGCRSTAQADRRFDSATRSSGRAARRKGSQDTLRVDQRHHRRHLQRDVGSPSFGEINGYPSLRFSIETEELEGTSLLVLTSGHMYMS